MRAEAGHDCPPVMPLRPQVHHLESLHRYYTALNLAVLRTIDARFDDSYPFIDTKLDLASASGSDFNTDDAFRGRNAVYGWIQGRGLESLAGHCRWLRCNGKAPGLLARLEAQLRTIAPQQKVANNNLMSTIASATDTCSTAAPTAASVPNVLNQLASYRFPG